MMRHRILATVCTTLALCGGLFLGVHSAHASDDSANEARFCEKNICIFGSFCDPTNADRGCDIRPFTGNGTCRSYDCPEE